MKFFEALDFVKDKKKGFKVFGLDHIGNKKLIWSGDSWEEARKIARDSKFYGNWFNTEIIDPFGNPVPPAGTLRP